MAIDFKRLLAEERAKARLGKSPVSVAGPLLGIRCCSADECLEWQTNRHLIRQGAGYSLSDDDLRAKLIATIDAAKTMGSQRLLVLRNCPVAVAERYNYPRGLSLRKINAVCNGGSTMVAWMDITNQSAEDAADLVLAITTNAAIING